MLRFELLFLALAFLLLLFLPAAGIFAPDRRASLNPMAIACFRFFTFLRPPDFSSPCLYSCMVLCIFFLTVFFDLGSDPDDDRFREADFLEVDFLLVGID